MLIMIIILCSSLAIQTSAAQNPSLRGDVNGDGVTNVDDAIYLLRHILLPGEYEINQSGDMNLDGDVDVDDAFYLLRHTLVPSRYPLLCKIHQAVVVPEVAATCTESGLTEGSCCAICGTTLVEQQSIAPLGHTVTSTKTAEPSCTEDGRITGTCEICSEVVITDVLFATGHHFGEYEQVKAATCTEWGVLRRTCALCGIGEETNIQALEHCFVYVDVDGTTVCQCENCGVVSSEDNMADANQGGEYLED